VQSSGRGYIPGLKIAVFEFMPSYETWTIEAEVTDIELLSHWKKWIFRIARTIAYSYHLNPADVEDIVSSVQLKLLGVDPTKRPYIGYCKSVINNSARAAIAELVSHGGGGVDSWKLYHTSGYQDAAPVRSDLKDSGEDSESALDRISPLVDLEDELVGNIALGSILESLPIEDRDLIEKVFFTPVKKTTNEYTVARRVLTKIRKKLGRN
jgi:hypothetical protein